MPSPAFHAPCALARRSLPRLAPPPPHPRRPRPVRPVCAAAARPSAPAPRPRRSVRPKQSLSQNFLRDAATIARVVAAFRDALRARPAARVLEVGPGLGALTRDLFRHFPHMRAIEIDRRAVDVLRERFPTLRVTHADVLDTDWGGVSRDMGGPLAVIGNLPYGIVSQILLSLFEAPHGSIDFALVMMQKEVAERITANTRTKAYGILSVVGQLYSRPTILFDVPGEAFYPKPDVTSAMVRFDMVPAQCFDPSDVPLAAALRKVLRAAFNQRRKVLRNSIRSICDGAGVVLPPKWAEKRAEELGPAEFVELTKFVLGEEIAKGIQDGESRTVWR